MPQFLAAVGASFLTSVGASAAFIAANALAFGVAIVGLATITAFGAARSRKSIGDSGRSIGNQQILVRSTTEPRKIVYGEAVVSGPVVWMNTTTGDAIGGSLYVAVALTGHEIDSFQGFFLDDKFVDISDVDTGGDGDVTGAPYAPVDSTPVLYLRGHIGSASQTVDTMLDSNFALWTSNHRGRGVSYFVARMDRVEGGEEVWEQGAPANLSALIRGKKVYDPRLDSTFTGSWGTGSGSHLIDTPSTWEYSSNPALCLADYLIDSDLGAGWDSARINYNSVALAADDCDDTVAIPTASTQARFSCNGVLSCLDTHKENIEKILSSMAGTLRYFGGQWHIAAGMWPTSSSFALTESDLIGDITFDDVSDRFNGVRGLYFDPSRAYKESAYLHVEDTTLRTDRDEGEEIWRELDLPMVNNEYAAQRLAIRLVEQASRPLACVFPMGYRGMDIAPGDRGTVTISEFGWSAKTFRCVGLRHVDFVGVELVLKEDDSAAYDDPAEGDYGTRTGATIVSFPKVPGERSYEGGSLIGDPFFSRTTTLWDGSGTNETAHWRDVLSTGTGTAVIAGTGGVSGGVLQISGAYVGGPGSVTVESIPRARGSEYVTGEYVRLNVRIRKTNNPTLTAGEAEVVAGGGDADGQQDIAGTGTTINLDYTAINAWTQDEWQEFEAEFQMVNVAKSSPQKPYAIVSINASLFSHDIHLEVDAANLTRIGTP